ncbi:SURF6-domain-containing protein [Hesseltinella vesiculosa]|uniref:SURF6-domain-containing protein n=1 Tax=Hesseltinella vesiculosa TaxID=101127 RepID=A0A1X2GQH8_9FUNG|nr:SURF6-domain-containing protein [Hesseltinella vesiculosa]
MVQTDLLDTLSDRIAIHADAFDTMLNLIPVKFYIIDAEAKVNNTRFMVNKRKLAPKQVIKENTKKAKKAKFDPDNQRTVADIQKEQAEKQAKEDEDDASVVSSVSLNGNDDDSTTSSEPKSPVEALQPMPREEINDLRRRLHERIVQQRQRRHAPGSTPTARSREAILSERLKKKQDRKKALKAQREKGKKAASEELVSDPTKTKTANGKSADSVKLDSDMFFGKLSMGGPEKKKNSGDAKSQLKKIENQKQKIEKLKTEDQDKAAQMAEKQEWQKAIAMATGEKVKDDVTLLKKTIKRQERAKSKSSQEWQKRQEKVKYDETAKVKKRNENIQKRIDDKKNRGKGKKARPGFEGSSRIKAGRVSKPKSNGKNKKK